MVRSAMLVFPSDFLVESAELRLLRRYICNLAARDLLSACHYAGTVEDEAQRHAEPVQLPPFAYSSRVQLITEFVLEVHHQVYGELFGSVDERGVRHNGRLLEYMSEAWRPHILSLYFQQL